MVKVSASHQSGPGSSPITEKYLKSFYYFPGDDSYSSLGILVEFDQCDCYLYFLIFFLIDKCLVLSSVSSEYLSN